MISWTNLFPNSKKSPELEVSVTLPHAGRISGTAVPSGIVLMCDGGYHGKATLLKAKEIAEAYPSKRKIETRGTFFRPRNRCLRMDVSKQERRMKIKAFGKSTGSIGKGDRVHTRRFEIGTAINRLRATNPIARMG